MYDRLLQILVEGETQGVFPFAKKDDNNAKKDDNKNIIRILRKSRAGLNVSINRRKGGPSRKNNQNQRTLFKLESANRSPKRVEAANEKYREARKEAGQVEGKPNLVTTKKGEQARRAQKAKNDLPFQAGRN